MATNPATQVDLTDRSLRTLSAQEISVGAILLEDAWNIIVSQCPSAVTRLDAGPTDVTFMSLVVQIECAMVLRVLNNPDGKLQEQIDDYSYRLDAAVSTGSLYLSDSEIALLSAGDGSSDTAFTIKPSGWRQEGRWVGPDAWVPSS